MIPAYQQRVHEERGHLEILIAKLEAFIDGPLWLTQPVDERARMQRQRLAMVEYSTVLAERIQAFRPPELRAVA